MRDWEQELAREEFASMRATIRERGHLRIILLPATIALWAVVAVATAAALTLPVATLIPLLVLAAGFEAIAALHTNVERIGRYIQVRFEADTGESERPLTSWERTSMAWGRTFPGTGSDPLFVTVFVLAAALNLVPGLLIGVPAEMAILALAHVLFVWRTLQVRGRAARQRAGDLERYRKLLGQ